MQKREKERVMKIKREKKKCDNVRQEFRDFWFSYVTRFLNLEKSSWLETRE